MMMTRIELSPAPCGCPRYEDSFPSGEPNQVGCGHTLKCKTKMEARARAILRAEKARKKGGDK